MLRRVHGPTYGDEGQQTRWNEGVRSATMDVVVDPGLEKRGYMRWAGDGHAPCVGHLHRPRPPNGGLFALITVLFVMGLPLALSSGALCGGRRARGTQYVDGFEAVEHGPTARVSNMIQKSDVFELACPRRYGT